MNYQFDPRRQKRGIEWCDATWNPVGGCMHGCRWQMPDGKQAICYAEEIANFLAVKAYPHGFASHYWNPGVLGMPARQKTPQLIFMDSMSDLFGHWVPDEQIRQTLSAAAAAPWHTFQALTKNAPRLLQYSDAMPANMWPGISSPPDVFMGNSLDANQQARMLRRSLDVARQLREAGHVTWMSFEPLSWDVSEVVRDAGTPLAWAVIGAATNGPRKFQPNPAHVRRLLDVLDDAGTAVFFKGNLDWSPRREDFPALDVPALRRRRQMAETYGWPVTGSWREAPAALPDVPEQAAFF